MVLLYDSAVIEAPPILDHLWLGIRSDHVLLTS